MSVVEVELGSGCRHCGLDTKPGTGVWRVRTAKGPRPHCPKCDRHMAPIRHWWEDPSTGQLVCSGCLLAADG